MDIDEREDGNENILRHPAKVGEPGINILPWL